MNINHEDLLNNRMSIEEIERLFKKASVDNDESAIAVLAKTFMPIVSDVGSRFYSRANFLEYDDIIQWGKEGIVLAIQNYGGVCNFSTYSRAVVSGTILDKIRGVYKDFL